MFQIVYTDIIFKASSKHMSFVKICPAVSDFTYVRAVQQKYVFQINIKTNFITAAVYSKNKSKMHKSKVLFYFYLRAFTL